jgi:hypothetical protein
MSSIDEFKAGISAAGGFINSSRFEVSITPSGSGELQQLKQKYIGSNRITLRPEVVSLPGSQIGSFEISNQGSPIKLPNIRTYEDVNMTFTITNNYAVVNFFKAWHDMIINKNSYRVGYITDYGSTIDISHLDREGKVVYTCQLLNAWPVGVNSIDLDSGASDIVSKLSIAITYNIFNDLLKT